MAHGEQGGMPSAMEGGYTGDSFRQVHLGPWIPNDERDEKSEETAQEDCEHGGWVPGNEEDKSAAAAG